MDEAINRDSTRSYLACAEPSWAEAVPERQLSGLLNLSCLLSEHVYLTDVHLGDNANFFRSYLKHQPNGLYAKLRSLAEMGHVRFLLRKEFYRPSAATPIMICNSFSDVYRTWIQNDPVEAWIYQVISGERAQYLEELDSWALGKATEPYDYQAVKSEFVRNIKRYCLTNEAEWFRRALYRLSPSVKLEYLQLVSREWFSLSDIYRLLHSRGLSSSHEFILYNGLVNERTYSNALQASLVGVDQDPTPLEPLFWPEEDVAYTQVHAESMTADAIFQRILEHASEVLDAPSLSVLALLTAEEIDTLRKAGKDYFDLLALSHDPLFVGTNPDFGGRFVRATAEYWNSICEYLICHHVGSTQKLTRLAIVLGRLPAPLTHAAKSLFRLTLNVGPTVAKEAVPGLKPAVAISEKVAKNLSLRFFLLCDTEELKKIRSVIPDRTWFARPGPFVTSDKEGQSAR